MDACRTIIVAVLALIMLQLSERLSYDAGGWHLAAGATATA